MESFINWMVVSLLVLASLGVLFCRSTMRAALALILTLVLQAVAYVLLSADYLAAMQILVYAGAIMVLFLFVVMLIDQQPKQFGSLFTWGLPASMALVTLFFLAYEAFHWQTKELTGQALAAWSWSGMKNFAKVLLEEHLFAFESMSLLLLVAIVGVVVLALKPQSYSSVISSDKR